jgi:thioredoxin 1
MQRVRVLQMQLKTALKVFSDSDFAERVEKSSTLVLVDFWGENCAPCRALAPVLAELAEENSNSVSIGKMKVEDNPKTATKYGVRGMPTILFLKDGQVKEMLTGYRNKAVIQKVIDANR